MPPTATHPAATVQLGQTRVRVLAEGATTGGDYCLLDVETAAGLHIPALVHRREELSLLVVQGAVRVALDGVARTLAPGDQMTLPRGLPHRLEAEPGARLLCLSRPCGLEALVRALADPPPPADDVAALLAAHEIQPLRHNAGM